MKNWLRAEIGQMAISSADLSQLRERDVILIEELTARPDKGEGGVAKLRVGVGRAGFLDAEIILEDNRFKAKVTGFTMGEGGQMLTGEPEANPEAGSGGPEGEPNEALATELVAITCISNIASVTGRAAKSELLLDTALRRSAAEPEMQVWVLTLLAEMATRRGDAAAAEARFRRALAIRSRDSYLLGAYADFLLDQKRPADAIKLVKDHSRIDALLLRHALALQQIPGSEPALSAMEAELRARFNGAIQRGDTVHQREQARFELHLRHDAKAALALAQKNWTVQKEPADIRIYLEAALQARDNAAAAPVLNWIRINGLEDVAAVKLVQQLKAGG